MLMSSSRDILHSAARMYCGASARHALSQIAHRHYQEWQDAGRPPFGASRTHHVMQPEPIVLGIVRQLYDATLDPGGWEPALAAVTAAVGGDHGLITVRDAGHAATDVVANVGV